MFYHLLHYVSHTHTYITLIEPLVIQWYTNATFGEGHGTPTLTNWRCYGNESFLVDCLHESGGMCYHSEDVGVSCQGVEVKGLLACVYVNSANFK